MTKTKVTVCVDGEHRRDQGGDFTGRCVVCDTSVCCDCGRWAVPDGATPCERCIAAWESEAQWNATEIEGAKRIERASKTITQPSK